MLKWEWNLILLWSPDFVPLIWLAPSNTLNINTEILLQNFSWWHSLFQNYSFSFQIHNTQESTNYLFGVLRKISYKDWKSFLMRWISCIINIQWQKNSVINFCWCFCLKIKTHCINNSFSWCITNICSILRTMDM